MLREGDLPVICYDLHAVSRFFRSVGMAVAMQQHTSIEWEEYRDSTVLNAVYAVLFWKEPPGTVEVRTSPHEVLEKAAAGYHERFLLAWIDKLAEGGPVAANAYVDRMARLREHARAAVQEMLADASRINSEIVGATNEAIRDLAYIRLGAAVGVAVIGGAAGVMFASAAAGGGAAAAGGISLLGVPAGASATTFGLVGLGHSVTKSVIKTWEEGPRAKVPAISVEGAKYAASEGGGAAAGKAVERALAQQARSAQIIRSAEGQIRKHSQRLAQESLKKAAQRKSQNIVVRSTAQAARESGNMARAGNAARMAGRAGMAIPVVFAAWEIVDAFSEFSDTMAATR